MRSRDADVAGSATLALESGALDGTVDLTLSEELSAQAGTDLARFTREKDRIVLPAKLGGTLEQPRITINAAGGCSTRHTERDPATAQGICSAGESFLPNALKPSHPPFAYHMGRESFGGVP